MDILDPELIERLEARDGPLNARAFEHDPEHCRYAEDYEGEVCPWCEAVRRRRERETARST